MRDHPPHACHGRSGEEAWSRPHACEGGTGIRRCRGLPFSPLNYQARPQLRPIASEWDSFTIPLRFGATAEYRETARAGPTASLGSGQQTRRGENANSHEQTFASERYSPSPHGGRKSQPALSLPLYCGCGIFAPSLQEQAWHQVVFPAESGLALRPLANGPQCQLYRQVATLPPAALLSVSRGRAADQEPTHH